MLFNERLRQAMQMRGIKQVDLVEKTGISKSGISQYLSGEFAAKQDRVFLLAKALEVDPSWLMGKNVPMKGVDFKRRESTSNPVPLVGTISAGSPILAEENIEEYFNIDTKIKADFALQVKGDSMINANIFQGDIVFIRTQSDLENGEIGAILIDDEATLKKFYRSDGNVILQAQNDNYKPIILTNGDVRVLGKMVAVLHINY